MVSGIEESVSGSLPAVEVRRTTNRNDRAGSGFPE